ncbi:hypothetical protein B566_EDAN013675 [Ephemera danica]|nr:hypothetical protein B566_EDAN013675 [Ephemera danica]
MKNIRTRMKSMNMTLISTTQLKTTNISSDSPTNMTRKCKMYCLYVFSFPLILIPAIIFLYIKINGLRSYHEVDNCTNDIGPFLIIPTFIIVVINIYFLVSTSRRIRTTRNNMQNIENSEFIRYKLYLNLFGLLGGMWSVEFLLLICGPLIPVRQIHPAMGVITNIWVSAMDLQGFFIFIVCVWMTHHRNVFLKTCAPCECAQRFARHNSTQDLTVQYRAEDQIYVTK